MDEMEWWYYRANGSIRFEQELGHGANAGLSKPFKEKYPEISWADLIQLASVTAVELAGGPLIPIRFAVSIPTHSHNAGQKVCCKIYFIICLQSFIPSYTKLNSHGQWYVMNSHWQW